MLTKKTLLTKWGLYALAMVLLFAAQQLFLDPIALSPLGASPFLAPMLVAVVAALEGPTEGTLFGTAAGILCDLSGGGVFSGVYTFSFFCMAAFPIFFFISRNRGSRLSDGHDRGRVKGIPEGIPHKVNGNHQDDNQKARRQPQPWLLRQHGHGLGAV